MGIYGLTYSLYHPRGEKRMGGKNIDRHTDVPSVLHFSDLHICIYSIDCTPLILQSCVSDYVLRVGLFEHFFSSPQCVFCCVSLTY